MSVIIAQNQTGGALTLNELPVPNNQIPGSSNVTLTDYATVSEIQDDSELIALITAGSVLLNVDGITLTQAESLAAANPVIQSPSVYADYYDVGITTVDTSATTMGLDTSRQANAAFVLSADAVTVQTGGAGDYCFSYQIAFGDADTTNRTAECWLEKDSGGGFSEVAATRSTFSHWDEHALNTNNTAGRSAILTVANGDVFRIRGQASVAGYTTLAGGVSLQIFEIGSQGQPGAQGPAGAGSTVIIKDEGSNIPNTPHSELNFVGAGVTATDGGSGVATITIPGGSAGANIAQYRQSGNLTINTSATTVVLNANDFQDSNYTRSGENITINTSGVYKISYSVYFDTNANARRTVDAWVEKNTVEIVPSRGASYARNNTDDTASTVATFMVDLTATDVIRLRAQSTGTSGTAIGQGNRMWICLEFMRA